jgi:hypothetical protein
MAQTGIPGTLYEIDVTKLGEASGPGGLIGSAVYGYQYFPLKDTVNFEETVPIIIVDKIRIPSNLPNRTEPNKVENQTSIIDVYVGIPVDPSIISGIYSTVNVEPVFIPANLITKIVSLPKVECCDSDDNDIASTLGITPSLLDMGSYPITTAPTQVTYPTTLQYTNLSQPVTVQIISPLPTGELTNWLWKKSSDTSFTEVYNNQLYYSLAELIAGGGYLDIDVRFDDLTGALGGLTTLNSSLIIQAVGEGGTLTDSATIEINVNNLVGL